MNPSQSQEMPAELLPAGAAQAARMRPNEQQKQEESIVPDLIEVGLDSTTDPSALLHMVSTGIRSAAAGAADLAAGALELVGSVAGSVADAACGAAEVTGHAVGGAAEVIGEVVAGAAELVGELIADALS